MLGIKPLAPDWKRQAEYWLAHKQVSQNDLITGDHAATLFAEWITKNSEWIHAQYLRESRLAFEMISSEPLRIMFGKPGFDIPKPDCRHLTGLVRVKVEESDLWECIGCGTHFQPVEQKGGE